MMKLLLLPVLLLASAFPLTAAEQGRLGSDVPPGKRYTYKQSAGQPRELEIYFPPHHDAAKPKVPGMILFHGGGWTGGSLGQFRRACEYFASRGLVCATAEYRMLAKDEAAKLPSGESRKRVCITDAKSAIRWFKGHAAEFGIDPQRIITGGGSAGGHISALATLNPGLNDPADPSGIDTSVVAYLWFNPAFAPGDESDAEVDVLRFLRKDIAPAITFFGTEDTWLKGWSVAFEKLKSIGNITTDMHFARGQAHSFFNKDPWQTVTLIAADRFLEQQGLLKGAPTLIAPPGSEELEPHSQVTSPPKAYKRRERLR